MLTLFEELFLLAFHTEKGAIIRSVRGPLAYGLSGAILSELALRDKVRVEENRRIQVADPSLTGDDILDKALSQLQESEHPRKITYWINLLGQKPKRMRARLTKRLVAKGVFTQEETRMGWVVPFGDVPDQRASAKYWIKNRLREVALTQCEPQLHDLALLGLVQACGMQNLVFSRDERKIARDRLYELMIGIGFNNPIAQSIQDISAAVEAVTQA